MQTRGVSVSERLEMFNSVFSCSSSSSSGTIAKRKLHQTRSLDSALSRSPPGDPNGPRSFCWSSNSAAGFPSANESLKSRRSASSLSTSSDASSVSSLQFEPRGGRRDASGSGSRDLALGISAPSNIFSPRKWLQRRLPPSDAVSRSEGAFTCKKDTSQSFPMQSVPIQSLSELERVRLQDVCLLRLMRDFNLGCQITIPKDVHKRKKSLRRKLDSLSKEKRDKECEAQAFGVPLSQVIFNDRRQKQQEQQQEHETKYLPPTEREQSSSSSSSLSSSSETHTPETQLRSRRRGGMSVDCITDLDDSDSRLLEALQLSVDSSGERKKASDARLSLNPIYRQVPRVIDCCCTHLHTYGLQTVGIFRVGSSKKRVRQLREAFDQGLEVVLDDNHSVHVVAALLKEFLRDMPDPLLSRELYSAFISCAALDQSEMHAAVQLLVCLLPACNSDTLQCLLHFLSDVANHAQDSYDAHGNKVLGNKMTSLNLATIFGPNLLHRQKSSEKEFSVQSPARMEDSTAIISIVQHMIDTHHTLFMISAELQNEVLLSLSDTDRDLVDFLMRRKTPQCEEEKCSSGEVSPYENSSPVLSQWFPASIREGSNPAGNQNDQSVDLSENMSPSQLPNHCGAFNHGESLHDKARIWRTRHALLSGLQDKLFTGSDGNLYKCSSSDVFYDDETSCFNSPPLQSPHRPITASLQTAFHQSEKTTNPSRQSMSPKRTERLPMTSMQPCVPSSQNVTSQISTKGFSTDQRPDWPTERWQIWQLLSSDSIDTLPETMV